MKLDAHSLRVAQSLRVAISGYTGLVTLLQKLLPVQFVLVDGFHLLDLLFLHKSSALHRWLPEAEWTLLLFGWVLRTLHVLLRLFFCFLAFGFAGFDVSVFSTLLFPLATFVTNVGRVEACYFVEQ